MSAVMPLDEPLAKIEGPLVIDEMIKIVSLLCEPNEQMRRALRFYKAPEKIAEQHEWGKLLGTLRHYECAQDPAELASLIEIVRGKKSLLEVGSCFGGTLKRMASVLAERSLVVSVDMPVDDTPKSFNPLLSLKDACRKISWMGHNVELFVGDSHSAQTVAGVAKYAPFDFGFIDGDHSYAGVKQDWENYGRMCKVVGFHDIAGPVEGCVRFWNELKGYYKTQEFITPGHGFGIGIVYRDS